MKRSHWFCASLLGGMFLSSAALSEPLTLAFPVACELGHTCHLQNYFDNDPSSAARDYRCGSLTYNGHNGTDIRLPTLAAQKAGVDVVASAAGRVLRIRDGMEDVSIKSAPELGGKNVAGAECGNAVVLAHENGWETQYCHLAKGSVRAKPGDILQRGDAIAKVGLSGNTEFPHLHFIVRFNGKATDPFAFGAQPDSCKGGMPMWEASLHEALAYKKRAILNAGFSSRPVTAEDIEAGAADQSSLQRDAALVAFVRVIGIQAGDIQKLTIKNDRGQIIAESTIPPLDRHKAQHFMFVGRKSPAGGWRNGTYEATYMIEHSGSIVLEKTFRTIL